MDVFHNIFRLSRYKEIDNNASKTTLKFSKRAALSVLSFSLLGFHVSALADHSTDPAGVALVGSLQSELGCAGDWQPECTATELTQNGESWQATFIVPAGSYEYKVALNDTWDESYGDNGNNIALFLTEESSVTFTYDHSNHQVADDAPTIIIQPNVVALVGSLQDELGCSGDWQPDCVNTQLVLEQNDLVWQGSFEIPAGDYEYKTALNGSWDENYGANAQPGGANIPLSINETSTVKFYYDHETHWITSDVTSVIAVVPGNFQSQLGCSGDWQPDCLNSWLQDPDGDGVYSFTTTSLVAGSYEGKVAHNESWDENYGQNGQQNGSNIAFTVAVDYEPVVFTYNPESHVLTIGSSAFDGNIKEAKAYWLTENTLAWDVIDASLVELHYSEDASLAITPDGLEGGNVISLTSEGAVDGESAEKFRHLAGLPTYKIAESDLGKVAAILKSQFAIYASDSEGKPIAATGIQPAGVLDDLYTFDGKLGVSYNNDVPSLSVWAPSAQSVKLHVFEDANAESLATVFAMEENTETGVWSVSGNADWDGKYYLFEVSVYARSTGNIENNLVTDPYSVSLSMNSKRSQMVDLNDDIFKPKGWDRLRKPRLLAPEDQSIYELHVRDFSIHDNSVPVDERGTFKAFSQPWSKGKKHLYKLSLSGLSTIHLLPAFDCATIPENPDDQVMVGDLSVYAADSTEQQAAIEEVRGQDAFNWCYDPFHYTVPEGSYSTNANDTSRINEFRGMVSSLNRSGLRVVMDVVYNHTSGSLQGEKSVLDKIVPDYYHRLNSEGAIEMSSCCANTATEHNMMEKLMLDSLRTWAVDYKVDGFRFDLMGHHTKANILKAQAMLHSLTEEEDGVDGSTIYLYGEGWNFGEVVNDTRFEQATQKNMGDNTGVGSFNDHIRDAVRGGGPFDSGHAHVENQGFINGQYYDPNAESNASLNDLLWTTDKVRMSLAGTLSDFEFENYQGDIIKSSTIGGYTSDPQEAINYIAAHDNETLFDANQYKLPLETSKSDRVRVQNLGNSIVALAQGVPFFHAGQDMMRSKSTDRNSYDAGDWFNLLDFTYVDNGWARGLPLQADNEANWEVSQPLLANPDLAIGKNEIVSATQHMREMMLIRQSSPLFRLQTAEEVKNQLAFHNTGPDQEVGLIVMSLREDDDIRYFVVFNASLEAKSISIEDLTDKEFLLHPVQRFSSDKVVRKSAYAKQSKTLSVPARTTAVFVAKSKGGFWPWW